MINLPEWLQSSSIKENMSLKRFKTLGIADNEYARIDYVHGVGNIGNCKTYHQTIRRFLKRMKSRHLL
ncbi:MAG: hypothetical protein H7A26_02085 [Spirochaetales bacterium]|nr:hypothetical protein [Spirochaetales bacterium]